MSSNTLKSLLQSKLSSYAEKEAFIILETDNKSTILKYKELDFLSNKLAASLNHKTEFADRVLVILPPGKDYITTLFGAFYSGLTAVPVYPPNPASLEQSIELISNIGLDSQAKLIVTNTQIQKVLLAMSPKFPYFAKAEWHIIDEAIEEIQEDIYRQNVSEDDLALLLYTSGSTGVPKGVMLSHKNLIHDAKIMSESCQFNNESKFCIWLPPYHVSGLFSGIILPIYSGATNILFSPLQFVENPFKWLKTISDYKVTASGSPTFAYDICNKFIPSNILNDIDLSSWKTAVVGGEAIKKDVLDKFIEKFSIAGFSEKSFHTMFGLTEATMMNTARGHQTPEYKYISRKKLEENIAQEIDINNENGMYITCSGSILNEMQIVIADPETKIPCNNSIVGEIWLSGDCVAQGYWNKPEETEKVFNAFTSETNPRGPFLRTGDFGFLSDDNKLYVTGRMKEVIIVRGVNHYPEDIEKTIKNAFPENAAIESSVFQTEINNHEELIVALELTAVLKDDINNVIGAIKKEIAKNHGLTPYGFVLLNSNELPRTVTRKIQRKQCSKNVFEGKWKLDFITNSNDNNISLPNKDNTCNLKNIDLNNLESDSRRLEIIKYLKTILTNKLSINTNEISDDTNLSSLGLDSILTVNLITDIRNDLKVSVPISKFFDETNIKDLANFIDNSIAGIEEFDEEIDFVKDYQLPETIKENYNFESNNFDYKNIFLTGVTGFLGGYLLNDLLINTKSIIYCLVRAKNKEEGLKRLKLNLEKTHKLTSDFEERVIPVLGDMSYKQLDIDEQEFDKLSVIIDVICHNGASVNFVAPYSSIKSTNVDSTTELLKLAVKNKIKPLHFVSSLGVFNSSDRQKYPVFYEDMINQNPEKIFGGYPKTKYVSEMMLLKAKSIGVPITIHRPGFITGDSKTGYTNVDDFFCRFVKGCIELQAFPDIDFDLDMTPVNYVSSAITNALTKKEGLNKVFHLANPEPIKFSNFVNWVINNGYQAKIISYQDWLKALQDSKTSNALYPLLPFISEKHTPDKITFLEMFDYDKSPKFDDTNTSNLLKDTKINCPPVNDSLLSCYFEFFRSTNFL